MLQNIQDICMYYRRQMHTGTHAKRMNRHIGGGGGGGGGGGNPDPSQLNGLKAKGALQLLINRYG